MDPSIPGITPQDLFQTVSQLSDAVLAAMLSWTQADAALIGKPTITLILWAEAKKMESFPSLAARLGLKDLPRNIDLADWVQIITVLDFGLVTKRELAILPNQALAFLAGIPVLSWYDLVCLNRDHAISVILQKQVAVLNCD